MSRPYTLYCDTTYTAALQYTYLYPMHEKILSVFLCADTISLSWKQRESANKPVKYIHAKTSSLESLSKLTAFSAEHCVRYSRLFHLENVWPVR